MSTGAIVLRGAIRGNLLRPSPSLQLHQTMRHLRSPLGTLSSISQVAARTAMEDPATGQMRSTWETVERCPSVAQRTPPASNVAHAPTKSKYDEAILYQMNVHFRNTRFKCVMCHRSYGLQRALAHGKKHRKDCCLMYHVCALQNLTGWCSDVSALILRVRPNPGDQLAGVRRRQDRIGSTRKFLFMSDLNGVRLGRSRVLCGR